MIHLNKMKLILPMNSMDDLEDIQPVKRSRAGFILSIIGAIIVLFGAISLLSFSPDLLAVSEEQLKTFEPLAEMTGMTVEEMLNSVYGGMGVFGIVCAILIIVGALLAYYKGMRVAGGIIIIIFSVLSIFSLGGFVIGMILGIVGGALILATK
jgi:hypothetical protein